MQIKLYRWTIDYDNNLADNWLQWKEQTASDAEVKDVALMKSVVVGGERPPLTPKAKDLIAEYLAYSQAPPSTSAHLFYVIEENGLADGWSIFPDLGNPKPLTIQVAPEETTPTSVTLAFRQPAYQYSGKARNGLRVNGWIKEFYYRVQFSAPDVAKPELMGKLRHPDVKNDYGEIKVGDTKLFLRIKGEGSGGSIGPQILQPLKANGGPEPPVAAPGLTARGSMVPRGRATTKKR